MNDQVLQTIHSQLDAMLPHDPLEIKQYLLPWWNPELFEQYGVKIPTGLLRNEDVVRDMVASFKFISERCKCSFKKLGYQTAIVFGRSVFLPGENFGLLSGEFKIFGNVNSRVYTTHRKDEKQPSEIFEGVDLDDLESDLESANIIFDGSRFDNPSQTIFPGYEAHITLHRPFNSQDRSLAIEEVKKSILWRALL